MGEYGTNISLLQIDLLTNLRPDIFLVHLVWSPNNHKSKQVQEHVASRYLHIYFHDMIFKILSATEFYEGDPQGYSQVILK